MWRVHKLYVVIVSCEIYSLQFTHISYINWKAASLWCTDRSGSTSYMWFMHIRWHWPWCLIDLHNNASQCGIGHWMSYFITICHISKLFYATRLHTNNHAAGHLENTQVNYNNLIKPSRARLINTFGPIIIAKQSTCNKSENLGPIFAMLHSLTIPRNIMRTTPLLFISSNQSTP
jgi:hypothetical protein